MRAETPKNIAATVTVECIGCGAKREVRSGEVPTDEMPMCYSCGNVMIAISAARKAERTR